MKVLHIVSGDLWAGAEAQALLLITHLAAEPGLQVHAVLLNEGQLAQRLRAAGIAITVIEESRHSALPVLFRLWQLQCHFKPQVVHTHRLKENILGSIAARLAGVPISLRTVHGLDEHPPKGLRSWPKRLLRSLDAWCCRYLQQAVVAVSADLGQQLQVRWPRARIEVIHNGIDALALQQVVRTCPPPQWDKSLLHVGIVGRLVPVKRVDLFMKTAALLRTRMPSRWCFHVIGDGPLAAPLRALAGQLNLEDCVRFHGHVEPSASWLAALNLLVMCSDHEGLPMVALEASALGIPVVAHRVGGLSELSPPLQLVSQQEPVAYAEAIERVAIHCSESQAQSAPLLPPQFTASQNAVATHRLYTQLLGST